MTRNKTHFSNTVTSTWCGYSIIYAYSVFKTFCSIVYTLQYTAQATGWKIRGFQSQHGQEIYLFTETSIQFLGIAQPPTQWVSEALSPGPSRPGSDAKYSRPAVNNKRSYTSTPHICLHYVSGDKYTLPLQLKFPLKA
jgi:hypothetical protein